MNPIQYRSSTPRGRDPMPGGSRSREAAFSLIEMIGTLAILAILAGLFIGAMPKSVDVATGSLESTNLIKYATALQTSILRTRRIPGTNNNEVASVIATDLAMDVKDVNRNMNNNLRAFLFDPGLVISTSVGGQGWTQTIAGGGLATTNGAGYVVTAAPKNPRVIILSSLGPALPSAVTNAPGLSASDFAALWNNADAPGGSLIAGVGAFNGWKGTGDDLKMQRINLSPFFVHLILYDYNYSSTNAGQFTIDRTLPGALTNPVPSSTIFPNTNIIDAYYLQGTMLGLLKSVAAGGAMDAEQILSRDTSFAYAQDIWRSCINLNDGVTISDSAAGDAFWAVAAMFEGSPYYSRAAVGVTPVVVVNDMATFMTNYVNWARAGFPASPNTNYTAAKNSQTALYADMANLVGATDQGNGTYQLNMVTGACTNPPAPP